MQNFNNPQQPQGGYGQPHGGWNQPPQRQGMSKGLKIFILVVGVLLLGVVLLFIAGGAGIYYLSRRAQESTRVGTTSPKTGLSSSSRTSAREESAEGPSPTEAQSAAIAGGQSAEWPQQEISWTVPQRWKKFSADSTSLMWRSPGSADAASLIVSISAMSGDFPTDLSLNAFYKQAETRKASGEVSEYRWLKLDGVKGVMFREAAPESDDSPQRLQWMGYRDYKGQKQLVNIMLATRGRDFARHEDALYGILYSTKLSE